MLTVRLIASLALLFVVAQAAAQEFSDPYSIMAPEGGVGRHHTSRSPWRARHAPGLQNKSAVKRYARQHASIVRGSSGVVLPTPLPRTQLIPPEGGSAPVIRSVPQQQGATVLPGVSPVPTLPHGPETFQDRAARCAFQQELYNVPGNLSTQYMGSCVQ
jgi:hypothetical protein